MSLVVSNEELEEAAAEIQLGVLMNRGALADDTEGLAAVSRLGLIALANSSSDFRHSLGLPPAIFGADDAVWLVRTIRAEPVDTGNGYRLFASRAEVECVAKFYEKFVADRAQASRGGVILE